MRWTRIPDMGQGNVGTTYHDDLGIWMIRKEWYADGPSLFEWVIYKHDHRFGAENTLRAAKLVAAGGV